MRITGSLILLALSCSLSCKEGSEQQTPPPSVLEENQGGSVPPTKDIAPVAQVESPPTFRPALSAGVALVAQGEIVEPPVSWNAGITTIHFQAREIRKGTERSIDIDMVEDDQSVKVITCTPEYNAVNAYLDSESVLYVVCETDHSEAAPGTSMGVRLQWSDGSAKPAGSFENEGPPAYDTMDFGEGE